ncbi:MAG: hypothetical protein Q8R37_04925, partial [Nanoarchaeota archaeon]|nr:hypothetical protein [Nanoarchaeota archaeon]
MLRLLRKRPEELPVELPKVDSRKQFKGVTFVQGRTNDYVKFGVLIDSSPEHTRLVLEAVGDFYHGNKALTERESTSTEEVKASVSDTLTKAKEHNPRLRHNFSQFHALSDFIEPLYHLHGQLVGNTYHCAYTHGGHRKLKDGVRNGLVYAAIEDAFNGGIVAKVFGDVTDFEVTARMAFPERQANYGEPIAEVPLVELVKNVRFPIARNGAAEVTLFGRESDEENFDDRVLHMVVDDGHRTVKYPIEPGQKAIISVGSGVSRPHTFYSLAPWYGPLPMLTDLLQLAERRVGSIVNSR